VSVAFTREESAETAAEVELPDRAISPHPNLVSASVVWQHIRWCAARFRA
jgi:hypothetical protein